MIRRRASQAGVLYTILGTALVCAADFSNYRGFQFGTNLPVVAKQAGLKLSDARLVHQRPAVIQELDWRPRFSYKADPKNVDPVWEGLLRFYNGELFQIVTTYDREKVEGMNEADMVEAISLIYGAATQPGAEIPYHSNYGEMARVIARWENSEYAYSLVRTGDQTSFALVLSLKRLDALAQSAIAEARRLDALEAPQKAVDLKRKQEVDSRLLLEKARSVNVPNFRP
jgi:hypothetical protein